MGDVGRRAGKRGGGGRGGGTAFRQTCSCWALLCTLPVLCCSGRLRKAFVCSRATAVTLSRGAGFRSFLRGVRSDNTWPRERSLSLT